MDRSVLYHHSRYIYWRNIYICSRIYRVILYINIISSSWQLSSICRVFGNSTKLSYKDHASTRLAVSGMALSVVKIAPSATSSYSSSSYSSSLSTRPGLPSRFLPAGSWWQTCKWCYVWDACQHPWKDLCEPRNPSVNLLLTILVDKTSATRKDHLDITNCKWMKAIVDRKKKTSFLCNIIAHRSHVCSCRSQSAGRCRTAPCRWGCGRRRGWGPGGWCPPCPPPPPSWRSTGTGGPAPSPRTSSPP